MTGKRIDLFDIIEDWLIPIGLIELFLFGHIAILLVILQAFGVI